jgi:hypothetical protein
MRPVGMFGDHSESGFWSSGTLDLGTPKITDFPGIIRDLAPNASLEKSKDGRLDA